MISVLIPAFNESERVAATIAAVRQLKGIREIILIDDGSTDRTAQAAEAAGADVVFRQPHRGKGAALQAGFELSTGEVILLLDADLGESALEAQKLIDPVAAGTVAMTIAIFPRNPKTRGGLGLAVGLARIGIKLLTGLWAEAPLSGQRAVSRQLIEDAGGFAAGWGAEIALTVISLWLEYPVLEIPTKMSHRVTGRSPADINHRFHQFTAAGRILFKLWRMRRQFQPVNPPDSRPGELKS